jgi:hypothetical protein
MSETKETNIIETPTLFNIQKEGKIINCSLGICKTENDFERYHEGIDGENIEEVRKNAKIHCRECNIPIPFHLLRGFFYQIIESPTFFKLLVTGKGTGKSVGLAIFQA